MVVCARWAGRGDRVARIVAPIEAANARASALQTEGPPAPRRQQVAMETVSHKEEDLSAPLENNRNIRGAPFLQLQPLVFDAPPEGRRLMRPVERRAARASASASSTPLRAGARTARGVRTQRRPADSVGRGTRSPADAAAPGAPCTSTTSSAAPGRQFPRSRAPALAIQSFMRCESI